MAPDAEKVRQRRPVAGRSDEDEFERSTQATTEVVRTLDTLKGGEVCIDGVVYDITSFDHPGGESILVFGGNDVTIQYKMIHPYHTDKHFEKMQRVGVVKDYQCEYSFDSEFERDIKREVFKIVRRGREFGTFGWFARAFVYIGLYIYLQYLWLTEGVSWQLAIVYGVAQAFIGLNVQHDANHGAASKTPFVNNLLGLGADFIGGSKWLWMQQHWTHHSYTNHGGKDPDAFGAEPLLLFHDYQAGHPKRKWFHSFQAFFYLFVLAGYWISSVFNPEVLDLRQGGAKAIGVKMDNDYTVDRRKYAIAIRLYYIFVHVVHPIMNQGFTASVVGNILLLGVAESLTLATLFSLSHNFVDSDRDPTLILEQAKGKKTEKVDWFKAQVETSCTYGGFISGCMTGGLNFQVEHHLFPRMSSAWYPFIAPKVREICKKHGVHYAYYPWIWQNLYSTLTYIHAAGTGSHWENNPLSGNL
mmetsp:Transcript_8385/g.11009  ORF Transcript_8385/g.11009 Transcript_8385/m.11009 type:complete len:471 (+) Transcript_8385:226-1638(+)|eukprot:CAMPEP_0198137536 /NCGR_PEP_ID=MMETSP1443-20131203/1001_1 /TAXON_ID=186043 /ORGANISM="Entomoneis sp., Strain CCMP2396" /LENGTH=470 /DNA_ID=CAMNT_0043798989 /DNA_START=190 /DNA_END=1605 /DNA_ORIENTATION=-